MEKEKLKELIIGHKEKFLSRGGLVRREIQDEIANYISHSFVILSDSEESDIIEILRRSAPQNDTTWTFYKRINYDAFVKSSAMPFYGIIMGSNLQRSYSERHQTSTCLCYGRQVCVFTVWAGEVLTSLHNSAERSTD